MNIQQPIYDKIIPAQCLRGIPPSEIMVPYPSIRSLLDSQMRWHGDKPFIIELDSKGNRRVLSFNRLFNKSSQGANFLKSAGISFGDHVAINPQNTIQTLIQFFSTWMIGATAVINQKELIIANQSVHQFSEAEKVFPDELREMEPLLSQYSEDYQLERKSKLDDEVMIVGKLDRNGELIAVTLTHYNILVNSMAIADWLKLETGSLLTCDIPLSEVSGIVGCIMSALYTGCPVLLSQVDNSEKLFDQIQQNEGHIIFTEAKRLSQPKLNKDLTHPRFIVCPHQNLTQELILRIYDKFEIQVIPGFCRPEATSFSTLFPIYYSDEEFKKFIMNNHDICIGTPLRSNELDIHNSRGKPLSEGEIGEIVIRGHNVMKGYLNAEKATQKVFKNGWLRTGENGIFRQAEDGEKLYYISG